MSTRKLSEATSVQRGGRPKGIPTKRIQRMLDAWDLMKHENPKLNNSALLNIVANSLFGTRLNPSKRAREKEYLKRALKRYGRLD